jgi:hypothetical protein
MLWQAGRTKLQELMEAMGQELMKAESGQRLQPGRSQSRCQPKNLIEITRYESFN